MQSRPVQDGNLRSLVLCALAALFEGFDNQSMGVAAPRLIPEFGLAPGAISWVFSAATFGLLVGAIIGGRVADRVGRKPVLIASLMVMGLCSCATALANSVESLLLARFLTGLGLGGAMPNFIALAAEMVEPRRRVAVVTVVTAALPFGGALAGMLSLSHGIGWDWRVIFYVGGIGPVVLALLMMPLLRESAERSGDGAVRPDTASLSQALFADGRASRTLQLWSGFFFNQLILLLMLNWLPTLFVRLSFSHAAASWAAICFNLSGSFIGALIARACGGPRRSLWVTLNYLGIVVALMLLYSGTSVEIALFGCALAGATIIGGQLVVYALAPLSYSTAVRSTGVGAAVAVGRFGSVVGPLYAGGLLALGAASSAVLVGIIPFVALGGAAVFALTRQRTEPDIAQNAPQTRNESAA
ncbi:AAHS family 3-hydroxyphenylpropionic acid transporter [Povalibacter uvarum]|uniref:AAHS family 3-hydroxyphenylpropionic acid transporter n=1 Tax=Povalibacter uvarum TaxID=732238 RepID=A0A841HUL0_9GAMM|nr:3-(3-hydroxy-phenyl)propionate transporter MhpT [Povalibacter uvarum]MBB6096503.1 AAHS family 3-hydroxyphenylpropionic acid transporter [Povalibacter uvarum]